MNEIVKAFSDLKIPHPMREIVIEINGLAFILLFDLYLPGFDVYTMISSLGFQRLEVDLILLISGLLAGRLLIMVSDLIVNFYELITSIFLFFLKEGKLNDKFKIARNSWKKNWKKKIMNFITIRKEFSPATPASVQREVTIIELAEEVKKVPSVTNTTERIVINALFSRMIFSMSLIAGIFLSPIFFIVFTASFLMFIASMNQLQYREHAIYRSVVKNITKQ